MKKRHIARLLRVDHAGEYGAVRIYEGQAAVFRHVAGAEETCEKIEEMAAGEREHLKKFEALLKQHEARPTALLPLWNVAGVLLGAATALMGEKQAFACTIAVEDVIEEHYASQIADLEERGEEEALRKSLQEFRADEAAHREEAARAGGEKAAGFLPLAMVIALGCRAAIALSSRF